MLGTTNGQLSVAPMRRNLRARASDAAHMALDASTAPAVYSALLLP